MKEGFEQQLSQHEVGHESETGPIEEKKSPEHKEYTQELLPEVEDDSASKPPEILVIPEDKKLSEKDPQKETERREKLEEVRRALSGLDREDVEVKIEPTKNSLDRPAKTKVTVVINAKNEEVDIGRVIESVQDQWFPGLEMVISDDGSRDSTPAIIRRYQQRLREQGQDWLILDSHENVGYSMAKNSGASYARDNCDWLFFYDADVPIPKGFIEADIAQMEQRGLDVASHYLKSENGGFRNWLTMQVINLGIGLSPKSAPSIAGSGGILIKKEIFDAIGGFGRVPVSEDLELANRAAKSGARVGMIHGRKMPMNTRRLEVKGRISTLLKWGKAALYNRFGRKFKEGELDYPDIRLSAKSKENPKRD